MQVVETISPIFFFFNDTATTEIYTLSLHDALPIPVGQDVRIGRLHPDQGCFQRSPLARGDRKSTRLNSSHRTISYAVFCLKKKIKKLVIYSSNKNKIIKNHYNKKKLLKNQTKHSFKSIYFFF